MNQFNFYLNDRLYSNDDFLSSNQVPIVPSNYLNRRKDLTSSWLIQLIGKNSHTGIMHIIEARGRLYANFLIEDENIISISYCEGDYDGPAKAIIKEVENIRGKLTNFQLNFTIDWNSHTFNGTIKDEIHKMRVLKGFKL